MLGTSTVSANMPAYTAHNETVSVDTELAMSDEHAGVSESIHTNDITDTVISTHADIEASGKSADTAAVQGNNAVVHNFSPAIKIGHGYYTQIEIPTRTKSIQAFSSNLLLGYSARINSDPTAEQERVSLLSALSSWILLQPEVRLVMLADLHQKIMTDLSRDRDPEQLSRLQTVAIYLAQGMQDITAALKKHDIVCNEDEYSTTLSSKQILVLDTVTVDLIKQLILGLYCKYANVSVNSKGLSMQLDWTGTDKNHNRNACMNLIDAIARDDAMTPVVVDAITVVCDLAAKDLFELPPHIMQWATRFSLSKTTNVDTDAAATTTAGDTDAIAKVGDTDAAGITDDVGTDVAVVTADTDVATATAIDVAVAAATDDIQD